jgi:hypothetical protein
MIHPIRAAMVDWAKSTLFGTFGARIYDRFLPVLDLESAEAMRGQFPALVISIPDQEIEAHLSGTTGIQVATSLTFEVYGLVNQSRLSSPSETVRAAEVTALRAVDTATAALASALIAITPSANWNDAGFRLSALVLNSFSEEDTPADANAARYIISSITCTVTTQ